MAVKYVKDFEFPASFGFKASATPDSQGGDGTYVSRQKFAGGGKVRFAEGGEAKPKAKQKVPYDEASGTTDAFRSRLKDDRKPENQDRHDDDLQAFREWSGDHDVEVGPSIDQGSAQIRRAQSERATLPEDERYAGGGNVHPQGHQVVDVVTGSDGSVVHHHAHGGFSHHHPDGHVTHHGHNGAPAGGSDQQMIQQADHLAQSVRRHERAEMQEEKAEGEGMAIGGSHRVGIPHPGRARGIKVSNPAMAPATPRNEFPGGKMPYGVEPGGDGPGGGGQGITQLAKGGRARARH